MFILAKSWMGTAERSYGLAKLLIALREPIEPNCTSNQQKSKKLGYNYHTESLTRNIGEKMKATTQ